ncbi:MAG: ABC transporter permease [Pirellulales bacterium]|nr:ABC transporter permease [Pirellulales bacterium]
MTSNLALVTIHQLVRDTFRQSRAQGVFWLLLGISAVCILLCASVNIEGAQQLATPGENPDFLPRNDPRAGDRETLERDGVVVVGGELTLGFGAVRVPLARDAGNAVHALQLALAAGVADTLGVLLALVWTAGFLPGFLDRQSISVLLAKPAPRWALLLGKYAGVLAFVLLQGAIFVGGTWLALGARTGIWDFAYLKSAPLLLLHFGIFFSVSLLLAVCTRSTVASVFGSIAFWLLCWGMNFGRHALVADVAAGSGAQFGQPLLGIVEFGYWFLPKPADLGMLVRDALGAQNFYGQPAVFEAVQAHGLFHPVMSVAASLAFMVLIFWAAVRQFAATDY